MKAGVENNGGQEPKEEHLWIEPQEIRIEKDSRFPLRCRLVIAAAHDDAVGAAAAIVLRYCCCPIDVVTASQTNAQSQKHTQQHSSRRFWQVSLNIMRFLNEVLHNDRGNNQCGKD